ncbi:LUD domain-containing protein [Sorangium sp. So ce124]|uniref:LUD domain-containing protein n=1 Tax=Sorangium sp. So ce124 TaxID=3133280 RepID=UPI003F63BBD4
MDADDFGITRAAGAIAETGTVILDDATTSTRLSALAPWIHVAIVRRADIHRSLCAEISALGGDPYVVRCTGPSKTTDVEGILIQGVHGPGEPIALIVDAWQSDAGSAFRGVSGDRHRGWRVPRAGFQLTPQM